MRRTMFNSNYSIHKTAVASLRFVLAGVIMLAPVFAQQPNQMGAGSASTLAIGGQRTAKGTGGLNNSALTAIPEDFADLRLAPGFLLDVQVYDEPEMSTQARVDKDGNVSLPLIGSVHVAGMTLPAAENALEEKFRQGEILKDPQVTLNVEQYASASITVLGEVQYPGRIQLLAPHNLLDVLGMAGGETSLAGDTVEVKSPGKEGTFNHTYHYSRSSNGDSIRNVVIQPGDTVTVTRAGIVYVLGAVNRPGGYVMQEDGRLNVAQALSLAQGTSMQAKTGALRVVRRSPDGQLQEIPVSYNEMMGGKLQPPQLQAEDIVYVPVSKIKSVFTTGANIVAQTSSALIYTHP
jgi:polysaccharide export outer membrane protein